MKGETYYRELLGGKRTSVRDHLLLFVLRITAIPYAGLLYLRGLAYGSGLLPSRKLPRPVISVGNLTVGGTGKTPTVALLARLLMTAGKRVVVLSRGYGGSCEGETRIVSNGSDILLTPAEAGDEPVLLASQLPGLMVVIGPDRFRAGQLAMEQLNPDVFILDDGYQHMRLHRDLNILLLDCRQPFGNGRTLPAGFLREPLSALLRADLVIFTRCQGEKPVAGIIPAGKPYCTADHALSGFVPLGGGEQRPLSDLKGEKGMAFAGIAEPALFFTALEEEGLRLITTLTFPDHCGYGEDELAALVRLKGAARPGYLITTAKDGVKLVNYREKLGNCLTAVLELQLHDETPLREALAKII